MLGGASGVVCPIAREATDDLPRRRCRTPPERLGVRGDCARKHLPAGASMKRRSAGRSGERGRAPRRAGRAGRASASLPASGLRASLQLVDLDGVAISAAIDDAGKLSRIDGLPAKIDAARKCAVPSIHTVVIAEAQRDEVEPSLLRDDPHTGFRVIPAGNVAEAVERLVVDQQTRWRDVIKNQRDELRRDMVGRQWLRERVAARIAGRDRESQSGYVLLT